jgi:hypothetical protein
MIELRRPCQLSKSDRDSVKASEYCIACASTEDTPSVQSKRQELRLTWCGASFLRVFSQALECRGGGEASGERVNDAANAFRTSPSPRSARVLQRAVSEHGLDEAPRRHAWFINRFARALRFGAFHCLCRRAFASALGPTATRARGAPKPRTGQQRRSGDGPAACLWTQDRPTPSQSPATVVRCLRERTPASSTSRPTGMRSSALAQGARRPPGLLIHRLHGLTGSESSRRTRFVMEHFARARRATRRHAHRWVLASLPVVRAIRRSRPSDRSEVLNA